MSFSKWWRRKHEKFRYWNKIRKMRAAAKREQRVRKVEKEKRKKRQAQSTILSWSQRWELYRLERDRRKRKREAWWKKTGSKHPIFRWFYGKKALLPWGIFLALGGLFVVFLLKGPKPVAGGKGGLDLDVSVLTVNGKNITRAQMIQNLELVYGPVVLQQLLEHEVIKQEAERQKIELTPQELGAITTALANDPLRPVHEPRMKTQQLLSKIALKGVTDERRRQVYSEFKDDLRMVFVNALVFPDRQTAEKFEAEVAKGAPLLETAVKFEVGPWATLGWHSLSQAHAQLGPAAAARLRDIAPNQRVGPINTPRGVTILWVRDVATSFEKVRPAIDEVIVQSESSKILFDLVNAAKLDSPYLYTKPKSKTVANAPATP